MEHRLDSLCGAQVSRPVFPGWQNFCLETIFWQQLRQLFNEATVVLGKAEWSSQTENNNNQMTRPDRRHKDRRLHSLQIRRARKEDREAIWQIFRAVVAGGDTYVFDPNISRRKALAYWLGPKTRCYVALSDQGIVGSYILKANQPGLGSHVANAGFMVSPSARGRGIGRAMAEHCLREAGLLGFRAMQFNFVVASNKTALRLWKNLGFSIVGTLPGAFRHTRRGFVDVYVMYRRLKPAV
jgi:ribosomal protein S18 acetylase RimI-like enzyme